MDSSVGAKPVGDGLLGHPQTPHVVVAPNGGADLIYLPNRMPRSWRRISSSSSPPRIMWLRSSSMTGWASFQVRCP